MFYEKIVSVTQKTIELWIPRLRRQENVVWLWHDCSMNME